MNEEGTVRAFEYRFENAHLRVGVWSEEAARSLSQVFPDYCTDVSGLPGNSPPDGQPFDLQLLATCPPDEGDRGWVVRSAGPIASEFGPVDLATAFGRLELHLADRLALGSRPDLLLHAGGVVFGERAVLIAGPSGSGKSSITTALATLGFPVLGDDTVIVDGAGQVRPFKRLHKIHEGARAQLNLDPLKGPLESLFGCAYFYHPSDLGATWAGPSPIGHVVFASRGAAAPLRTLTPAQGIRRLLELFLGPDDRVSALTWMVDALAGVSFFELAFDRCDRAGAELVRAFANG